MPMTLVLSYTTTDILLTVMPDIGSRTALTSAQIMNFAGEAQAEVNGAIVKHYALPLTVEVPALQAVTNRIAIYNILALRVFTAERLNASAWPAEYEKAKEWLARISTGEIPLVDASGTVVAPRTDVAEVWCLDPNTRVLTVDLRWIPVASCHIGDELLAFDEHPAGGKQHRKMRTAHVTATDRVVAPAFLIEMEDGRRIVASGAHQWLGQGPNHHNHNWSWRTTQQKRKLTIRRSNSLFGERGQVA